MKNNRSPLVSVVIPVYNREKFVKDSINSVLNQKDGYDLEIIVVDDGSTDHSEDVIKMFGDKVNYFRIPHSGLPSKPRNFAIAKAKGKLIAFQDSDDLWSFDKLLTLVPFFDDENVVLAYGNAEFMTSDGKKTGKKVIDEKSLEKGLDFNSLITENVISTLTVIARKSALNKVGLFNESSKLRAVEDYHLWLRMLTIGKAKYTTKTMAYYRRHNQNISGTSLSTSLQFLVNLNKMLVQELPSYKKIIYRQLAKLNYDLSNQNIPFERMYWIKSQFYKYRALK